MVAHANVRPFAAKRGEIPNASQCASRSRVVHRGSRNDLRSGLSAASETPPASSARRLRRREAAVDLASVHADAPGIAWFDGDVDAAFASAQASNKPVLLYWGAQVVPALQAAQVRRVQPAGLHREVETVRAVYLDGDLPDAQKWGDVFRVMGYPTVVVLKPDRTEITRIAGNMDLSLYAGVLDDALGDVRPVKDVVDLAVKGEAPLGRRRLPPARVSRVRSRRRRRVRWPRSCRPRSRTPRASAPRSSRRNARVCICARPRRRPRCRRKSIGKGGKADKSLTVLIVRVNELLANKDLALANADALRGLPAEFFLAARQTVPQVAPTLRQRYMAIADAATANRGVRAGRPARRAAHEDHARRRPTRPTARCPPTCAASRSRPRRKCWTCSRSRTCARAS